MINTIFYFTDTQLEYTDNYAQGSVKPHTICFAKDTKTIWRDGQRFSGMLQNEVDDEIHNLTDDAINNLKEGVRNLESGLNTAVRAAAEEKIRLNGEISRIDSDVATVASNLTATAAAIRDEVRNGELYTSEGWDPKINAYLKTVGLWDYGTGDTEHVTKWSTLRQSVSDVSSEVNQVEAKADGYNNTLQSKINQEVTDRGKAVTTLNNTFARSTEDLQSVIEWMYSGLHSSASADMSYAEIIAAGKNGASSAISDLRTSIETTSDGKYVAQSSLTSSVDNAISGIVNDVTGKYANTSVFSQIDTNSDNIAAINTFIGPDVAQSTLAAKLNKAEAGAVATVKDDLASMHILSKSGNNYTADVYTKSQTDGAISSATASMATTDDLQRSMGLVYTKTEADSRTNQLISEAGLVSENEFTAASIIAKVNGASSSVKINADHISIDADHQLDLSAQNINVLATQILALAADVTVKSLNAKTSLSSASDPYNEVLINGTDGIQIIPNRPTNNTPSTRFNLDGSGYLANGYIQWNTTDLDAPEKNSNLYLTSDGIKVAKPNFMLGDDITMITGDSIKVCTYGSEKSGNNLEISKDTISLSNRGANTTLGPAGFSMYSGRTPYYGTIAVGSYEIQIINGVIVNVTQV